MYDVGECLLSDILSRSHMTQQELANRLGVTRQQIHYYCTNERVMSLPIAKNIAAILNCEIDDLYVWIRVKERKKRR